MYIIIIIIICRMNCSNWSEARAHLVDDLRVPKQPFGGQMWTAIDGRFKRVCGYHPQVPVGFQTLDLQLADRNLVEDEQRHRCGLSSVQRGSDVQRVAGDSLGGHRSLGVSYFVYISLDGERERERELEFEIELENFILQGL